MQRNALTPSEIKILSRNSLWRVFLTFAVIFMTFFVIIDLIFLLGVMREDMPEWVLIPFVLGLIAAGSILGIVIYMSGKLKVIEKARFVLTSILGLLESNSITKRKLANTLNKIASALINNSSAVVSRELISEGWQETRARYLTELVESLIIKCEWSIDSENQIAGFAQLLKKNNWQDDEVALMISPVQELINRHGGRLTRSGIARSITRNVIYIIIILILTPISAWMLFTFEVLEDDVKYEIIKFLILVIPALGALIYNLVQIARRRRG